MGVGVWCARPMHRNRALVDLSAVPGLFKHAVARAPELIALGLSSTMVYARTAPGGPWQRLLPGILLLSNGHPTREQFIQAALCYAGPKSVLTGHDALQLHGMRSARPGGPVHVLVPHGRQVRGTDRVIVERTTRMPRLRLLNDFPTAPLERAVLDAARRTGSVDGARAIIAEAVQRGRVLPARLRTEL